MKLLIYDKFLTAVSIKIVFDLLVSITSSDVTFRDFTKVIPETKFDSDKVAQKWISTSSCRFCRLEDMYQDLQVQ